MARLSLFPLTTEASDGSFLIIGGYDGVELAAELGTPRALSLLTHSGLNSELTHTFYCF